MNSAKRLALFDRDQRIEIEFPGTRREVTPHVVRHVEVSGTGEGMITHSRLSEENADDVIREQVRYFEGLGQDFEWKLYDYDQPPDLKGRLAAHGFAVEEEEAIMVLDLDLAPEVLWGLSAAMYGTSRTPKSWRMWSPSKDRSGTRTLRRWASSWGRACAATRTR